MFPLTVATVDKHIFDGDVVSVTCPGREGELTVLAHHEPFMTILTKGTISIRKEKNAEAEIFDIEHGLLEVANNQATILI